MIVVSKYITSTRTIAKDTPRMAFLKDVRAVVEDRGCTIWGKLPDIPYKSDKFELGFTSKAQK